MIDECAYRSRDPTLKPTADPTADPTEEPTTEPTLGPTSASPSNPPSAAPSNPPTAMPTVPTMNPTASPIPVDVSCGEQREGPSNGEWEYYLDIDNDSVVTFDTCSSYLNLFSMWIYTEDDNNSSTLYAECIECGSICLEESQFRVAMDNAQ